MKTREERRRSRKSLILSAWVLLILYIAGLIAAIVFCKAEPAIEETTHTTTAEVAPIKMPEMTEEDIEFELLCQQEAKMPELAWDFEHVVAVVAAECRGEPYEGQVAVCQCILETSIARGITPEEVVDMPNRYADPLNNEEAKELVRDACINTFILGERATDEPIEYFYSTVGGFESYWHETALEYVMTIGNHKFFKTYGNYRSDWELQGGVK